MGESTHQIERDIAAERNELGRNLQLLESKARSLADWRTYFRNHPFAMMAVALGGGVVLGALTTGRMHTSEPQTSEGFAARRDIGRARRQLGDTWDHIADALLGVAAAKTIEFVSELVPGFREQYAARHPEHKMPFSSGVRNG